ncbi:leukocyte receptor cluster member 1 homolog [Liolophura sinensis]|uniref:leukocyte receptor cluster member 1 homolog n=1 Tax=Liolophura sinensis TaxID=3198878 RepID=UPI0031586363
MNILPQKSWHVRTKKNIERVRRDEEKAAEEEKERQRRIALAEQEARTELLRQRAKNRLKSEEEPRYDEGEGPSDRKAEFITAEVNQQALHHINFFSDIEEGKKLSGKNAEHEAEKKEEQEKLEMKIGLLTYLGQGSAESQTEKPWYLKKGRRKLEEDEEDIAKSLKLKRKMNDLDPMKEMLEYVKKKKKSSHHSDKHKKHKHKHHHKDSKVEKKSEKILQTGTSHSTKSLEQLRAERLRREADERQRSNDLMRRLRGEPPPQNPSEQEAPAKGQRYNSQYNPDFVRQPIQKRDKRGTEMHSSYNKSRTNDRHYHDASYSRHATSSGSSRH